MADNDITEFEEIDPLELHLVATPANGFAPLVAKAKQPKGKKMGKKSQAKALARLLKEAGHTSGADPSVAEHLARAIVDRGVDLRGARAVMAGFDAAVAAAKSSLSVATTDLEKMRATEELRSALQRRATAKLIAADNARARGRIPSARFGPNSAELFKNTHTIGDDSGLEYPPSRTGR